MKPVLIKVKQTDIDDGTQRSSCRCPIARAINRAFGLAYVDEHIDVLQYGKVYYTGSRQDIRDEFRLPPIAKQFITDFDAGRTVNPFNFELSPYSSTG